MCNDIPGDLGDPWKALEVAKERGWFPLVVILGRVSLGSDEEPTIDASHLHYLWNVNEEVAVVMSMNLIVELQNVADKKEHDRVRRN